MRTKRFFVLLAIPCGLGVPSVLSAQATRVPNPRAQERIVGARAQLDSLDRTSHALRKAVFDGVLGTATWLELSADALRQRHRSPTVDGAVSAFLARHDQAFGLDDVRSDLAELTRVNAGEMTHVRMRQSWNGLPVYGSDLRLHVRAVPGGYVVETANGRMHADIEAPAAPSISVTTALHLAGEDLRVARHDSTQLTVDSTSTGGLFIVPADTRYALAYSLRSAHHHVIVDASSGQILQTVPVTRTLGFGDSRLRRGSMQPSASDRAADVAAASKGISYESAQGVDALDAERTFKVLNAGSTFELRSNELGSYVSEVIVRELGGEHLISNCLNHPAGTHSALTWPNTSVGRQQVSGMVNTVGSGRFYGDSLGRRSYDDGSPGAAVNTCVNGRWGDPGSERFQAVASSTTLAISFVRDNLPTYLGSAAARDIVTHEFTHLVTFDEDIASNEVSREAGAVNEGLADYFGTRHRGNACLGEEALFSCGRDLTTLRVYSDSIPPGFSSPEIHYWGQAVGGALWSVGSLSSALGHDVDRATHDAMRYYMIKAETMLHTRMAIVRAAQDRMHVNQNLTAMVPHVENAFYNREIGPPAIVLSNAAPPQDSCGWAFNLDVGGPFVTRRYSVTFWDGTGQNQDQSVTNAGFIATQEAMGEHTGPQEYFQASPAGTYGHTPNDGHYHGFRVRVEETVDTLVMIHDYYKSWSPDYFCEEQLEMSVQAILAEGAGTPPPVLSVRQALDDSRVTVLSLQGGSGESVHAVPGLAARVARDGLLSFDYGVPVRAAGQTSIRIYDLRGRLVRSISDGGGVPGWTRVRWDARDDAGNPVSHGVYVAVIRAAGEIARTRLIVPAR